MIHSQVASRASEREGDVCSSSLVPIADLDSPNWSSLGNALQDLIVVE